MIYFIQASTSKHVKIGFTDGDPGERLSALQTGCPEKLDLLVAVEGDRDLEQWLHDRFSGLRTQGEWFAPDALFFAFISGVQFAASRGASVSKPTLVASREANRKRIGELLDKIEKLKKRYLCRADDVYYGAQKVIEHDSWNKNEFACRDDCKTSHTYCVHRIRFLEGIIKHQFTDLRVADVCRELIEVFEEGNRLDGTK